MYQVLIRVLIPEVAAAATVPPATVLEHTVSVEIDAARRLTETVRWTVRIDDPAACVAGLVAPHGLDGASDGAARVLEELLIVPADTAAGATFSLTATRTAPAGSHSGVFQSAPELPVVHAQLTVEVPQTVPLTVWADPSGTPTFDARRSRHVVIEWTDVAADQLAEAAWSSWTHWFDAARSIGPTVDGRMSDRATLGRALVSDIDGLGVPGIALRMFDTVALDPGPPGTWEGSRTAAAVVGSGHGTAAERGVLLIAMLRSAGIPAEPAWFRPSGSRGAVPITVPAPALLPRPLVVVRGPEGTIYVDPAADRATIPENPASLLGATVWVPGELPVRLPETGVTDGAVAINSTSTLTADGAATWTANLVATGAAQEYLRDLLVPLDEAGRVEAFTRLARQARLGGGPIQVTVSGLETPSRRLAITVSGQDPHALAAVPFGLRGTVAPTLAPALGAWLPPRIAITETLAISPPATMQLLGSALDRSAFRPEALVGRHDGREGQRLVLTTEVERPYRATSPSIESRATSFLAEQAPKGVELLLFGAPSGTTGKALRTAEDLGVAERAVLEALMWFAGGNTLKATKTLKRAMPTVGFDPMVAALTRYGDPEDPRPWEALASLAELDDLRRMSVVEGLEQAGGRREAWTRAIALRDSSDPEVRIRAMLMMARLQGPKPDPALDPDNAERWVDPHDLALFASQAAATIPGRTGPDPRVALLEATLALTEGDSDTAEPLLASLAPGPRVAVLLAHAEAIAGLPVDRVRDAVSAAVAEAPADPAVISGASAALARVGDTPGALDHALVAARLADDDPDLWSLVVPSALAAGDLPTATSAAKRASDLDPESRARADEWATLATLMLLKGDVDAARIRARTRAVENWPPTVDDRLSLDEAALLAVLEYAEDAVASDRRLLAIRAQLRIANRQLDEAARDGWVLATRHQTAEGWALAFAATAGRQYSTSLVKMLDDAAKTEPTAIATRMEYRLVSGAGDPMEDARKEADDPRARDLVKWTTTPKTAVAALDGWPTTLGAPSARAPVGYRSHRTLSVLPGVVGFSNPEAMLAVVRVGAVTGLVPPPFGLLYTRNPQVVERYAGGQVLQLDGGVMPLYAAVSVAPDARGEVWGFAFTVQGAKHALRDGLGAP